MKIARSIPEIARRAELTVAILAVLVLASLPPAMARQPAQPDIDRNAKATNDPSDTAPAPKPQVLVVEGQVTDAIGAGIKDVEITVYRKGKGDAPGDELASGTTDRIGDFAIMADQAVDGEILVTFSSPKFTAMTWSGDATTDGEPSYLAITLEGNLKVTGRVLADATDKPVAGAAVELRSYAKQASTKTDEEGRFTFEKLSRGAVTLFVTAEGYGKEQLAVEDTADPNEPIIKLKPERILHLRIIDDEGRPVGAVTVELLIEANHDVLLLSTDTQGRLTIRNLCFACTELSVRLSHEDHVSSVGFDRTITIDQEAVESTQTLTMTVAGTIAGTVTSADDQQPLNGARITTGDGTSDRSPRDWSNYRGQYEIEGANPGPTVVTTHLSGYAPELTTVNVAGGVVTTLDIQLTPACIIRGTVMTKSKTPLPHAIVQTGEWRGHLTLDLRAITDEDGKFVIENAPCDQLELMVLSPDGQRTGTTILGSDKIEHVVSVPDVDLKSPGKQTVKVGDTVPALSLTSLAGQMFELDKLREKVIVIDFWATWCGPCIMEWPAVERIQKTYGARDDFLMIGVSQDWDNAAVRRFLRKKKDPWPQVVGDAAGAAKASEQLGVVAIPSVFVIDKAGKFVATYASAEQASLAIAALLEDPKRNNEP